MEPITLAESKLFRDLEQVIKDGQESWLAVGLALTEIRDKKLYRSEFATFKEYCEQTWGWTDKRAYQLIAASDETSTTGRTFNSEREARQARQQRTQGNKPAPKPTTKGVTHEVLTPIIPAAPDVTAGAAGNFKTPEVHIVQAEAPAPKRESFANVCGISNAESFFSSQVEDIAKAIIEDASDDQLNLAFAEWQKQSGEIKKAIKARMLKKELSK